MTDKTNEEKEETFTDKIEAVGQIIVGEIEKIGGILTADGITQDEGIYNIDSGILHAEGKIDPTETDSSDENSEPESGEK